MWTFPPCSGKKRGWIPSSRLRDGATGRGKTPRRIPSSPSFRGKPRRPSFSVSLDLKGPEGQDQKKILPLMADPQTCMPFREVAERFRLIETNTRTVYLPWGEGKELIQRLEQGERSRELFRSLGQYSVEVYPNHFQALDSAGALQYLEDGSGVLTDTARYSKDTGLALGVEGGQAEFI